MNMKKFTAILTMVLLAALPMVFTSCEQDDDDIAFTMDGVWYGQVASEYFTYRYGSNVDYTDVIFEFWHDRYDYARGTGREVDYYGYGYSEVVYFDYEVRGGIIYLFYEDGTEVRISNYRLFGDEFRGDFHDARNGRWLASFDLVRDYDGWDYRYNYYVKKGYVWADEDDDVATDSIGKN